MTKKDENIKKNQDYLESLLGNTSSTVSGVKQPTPKPIIDKTYDAPSIEYTSINIDILPAGRYYKRGTKIMIRGAKVSEIQAYSMVSDNYVDITEKMNELLSRNIRFYHPDGTQGNYKNVKDSDRIFLIFMIRELTFQGGNTLTHSVSCEHCKNDFVIPFRSTPGNETPSTFNLHEPNELIEDFYNKQEQCYEIIHNGASWKLGPPTIGIQEDFYEEIKRNVQSDKKPDVAFMKIIPFLLYDRSSITDEGLKAKQKEFQNMNDLELFQGLDEIINNMKVGIKGLKMKCPECSMEVCTDLTFQGGASSLFKLPGILDKFRRRK